MPMLVNLGVISPKARLDNAAAAGYRRALCRRQDTPWLCLSYRRRRLRLAQRLWVSYGSVPPHFHAVYGEYEVTIEIETGVVTGKFPKRALGLVLEWNALHRNELIENWELTRHGRPLKRIAPLE